MRGELILVWKILVDLGKEVMSTRRIDGVNKAEEKTSNKKKKKKLKHPILALWSSLN